MVFDFKKALKEFYPTKTNPTLVKIPKMNFLAVADSHLKCNTRKFCFQLILLCAVTNSLSRTNGYAVPVGILDNEFATAT